MTALALLLLAYVASWVIAFTGLCAEAQAFGRDVVPPVAWAGWVRAEQSANARLAAIPLAGLIAAMLITRGFRHGFQWGVHAVRKD